MKAIINTKLIMEEGIIWDGALTFDNNGIISSGWKDDVVIPADAQIIDAHGQYTAPGFIDVHNHGGAGHWFYEDPLTACEHFLRHGQTTVLPALYFSLDYDQTLAAITKIREAGKSGAGRIIGGIYMEGPYMDPNLGSDNNNIKWKGRIDEKESRSLVDFAGDFIKVWCVDPAREGIEAFVQYAKEVNPGVVFSIGHSIADPEACYKLKKYGLRNQTHHSNSGITQGLARGTHGVGPDEACLYDHDLYAEMICDSQGIHMRPFMLRLVIQTKGIAKVILITDSSIGSYPARAGVAQADDLGYDSEGHLSGSKLTLDVACRNLMKHTGYGLCHAVRFATINPARMLGIDDQVGSLEPGKKANIIIMDDSIHLSKVILEGDTVFEQ
jgi:N-acetylglucosamine-6-phosphate deacetylase